MNYHIEFDIDFRAIFKSLSERTIDTEYTKRIFN